MQSRTSGGLRIGQRAPERVNVGVRVKVSSWAGWGKAEGRRLGSKDGQTLLLRRSQAWPEKLF